MISDRMRTVVLGVVTVIWAMNFFAGIIIEDYKPDQAINGIFMAIAGTLFALGGRGNGNGNGSNSGSGNSTKNDNAGSSGNTSDTGNNANASPSSGDPASEGGTP